MNAFIESDEIKEIIRIGLPSKGRMEKGVINLLNQCGLDIQRNSRDYLAYLKGFPNIQIVFQRPSDIVKGVANGLLSLGIAGFDLVSELNRENVVIVHNQLGFGKCNLSIAVPENWDVDRLIDLDNNRIYKIASKFPNLTTHFLKDKDLQFELIDGAGTLEVSPALGNSDFIVDLVSTGQTLAANKLKPIKDGKILISEAVLIGNKKELIKQNVLELTKTLLQYIEATLLAKNKLNLYANFKGEPENILPLFEKYPELKGLQGPTVSSLFNKSERWFAIHIVIQKKELIDIISAIREVGGSGVIVTPTIYVFEEISERYEKLLSLLNIKEVKN